MKRIDAKELINRHLTVRDLMLVMDDIDVYDDVCESLAIAFCNPFCDDELHDWREYLTDDGMKKFGEVLDYRLAIWVGHDGMPYAVVGCDSAYEFEWKRRLKMAKEFFESAAGYCSCEDYNKWFRM